MLKLEGIGPGAIDTAAAKLMETFPDRRIFAFKGLMGAGKTTFIKALGKHLNVEDVVNSPTFALVNVYLRQNGEEVYHFDLYRINKTSEVYNLGFLEYVDSGSYCFIEWPDIMMEELPENAVVVEIVQQGNDQRTITASPYLPAPG